MLIRAYATLRDLLGISKLDISLEEPVAMGQVLHHLAADYPLLANKLWDVDGNLTGYVTILLNGRSVEYLQGQNTLVMNDDTVSLFPPVGGG